MQRKILAAAFFALFATQANAAKLYATSPEALQLRAMNIIYETTKERGATILMPTSMVDAMNPGIAMALAGKAVDLQQPRAGAAPAASVPQVPRES